MIESQHSESVFVSSSDLGWLTPVISALNRRGYRVITQLGEISRIADAVIVDQRDPNTTQNFQALRANHRLARAGFIVISEEPCRGAHHLPPESTPTDILVKLSTTLRLRKLEAERLKLDLELTDQNLMLRDLTTRMKRELQEAQTIQRAILPSTLPEREQFALDVLYEPLDEVGGDLYDCWFIDEGTIGLFIGDVTGHGLSAAFLGAMTKMARNFFSARSPAVLLESIHGALAPVIPEGRFVTAAAAVYEVATGSLTVANAGHPKPFIKRSSSTVDRSAARGLALGMPHPGKYTDECLMLGPGDSLIFYTDGITEAQSMRGDQLGMDGIQRVITELSGANLAQEIRSAVGSFTEGRLLHDDITIFTLTRR